MKQLLLPLCWGVLLLTLPLASQAQTPGVGIGTTAPDASAALDIVSSNKGALLPRVASVSAVTSPATGLLVFQTGAPAGFYYNAGTAAVPNWQQIATAAGAAITANNGLTKTGSNVQLGGALTQTTTITQGGNNLNITGGNVGIGGSLGVGTLAPTLGLDVANGTLGVRNGAAWDHQYLFHDGSTSFYRAGGAEGGLSLQVGASAIGTYGDASQNYRDVMRLMPSGNVGIGTSAPTAVLDVNGTTRLRGLTTAGIVTTDALGNLTSGTAASLDATTASNGLTEVGNDVRLGGALTQATTLAAGNNSFSITQGTPAGAPAVDQNNLTVVESGFNNGNHFQTFTAGVTGNLTQLELRLGFSSGFTPGFTLNIRSGAGTGGAILYTANLNFTSVGSQQNYAYPITGVALTAGQVYTIQILDTSTQTFWSFNNADSYPAGGSDVSATQDRLFRTTMQAGGTGTVLTAVTGQVGVNTAAPTATLHVGGATSTVRLEGLSGTGTRLVTADSQGNLSSSTASTLDATTASNGLSLVGNDVRLGGTLTQATTINQANFNLGFTGTGNVGIGTTTPGQKLDVAGVIQSSNTVVVDFAQTNTGTAASALHFGSAGSGEAIGSKRSAGGNQFGLDFYTGNASRMNIGLNGNVGVGVGTAIPANRLQVVSADNNIPTNIADFQALNLTQGIGVWWGGLRKTGTNVNSEFAIDSKGTGNVVLNANGGTGNVGIGTATPGTKLDVNGVTRATAFTFPDPFNGGDPAGVITSRAVPVGQGAPGNPGAEIAETIIFQGNDGTACCGPDRITLRAPLIRLQTFNNGAGSIDDNAASIDRFTIDPNGTINVAGMVGVGTRVVTADAAGNLSTGTAASLDATTASNGLSLVGNDVRLGGTLTQATTINQANFNLGFTGTGNVGIGTTTPGQKLSVNGNVFIPSINDYLMRDTNHGIGWYGDIKPWNGINVDGPVVYGFSGGLLGTNQGGTRTTALTWNASGRVGIGTTSPQNLLDLGNSLGSSPSDVAAKKLSLYNNASGSDFYGFGISAGQMHLYTNALANGAPRMSFSNNGNVGIGTTAPTAVLDVNGSTRLRGLTGTGSRVVVADDNGNLSAGQAFPDGTNFIQNQNALDQAANFRINGSGVAGGSLTAGGNLVVDNAQLNTGTFNNTLRFGSIGSGETIGSKRNAGGNQFGLDFYTSSINRMSISSVGNVGFGTSAPAAALHLYGGSSGGFTPTNGYGAIMFGNGGVTRASSIQTLDDGNFGGGLFFNVHASTGGDNWPTGTSTAMTLRPNGFVGVGTITPVTQLANTNLNIVGTDGNGISTQSLNWVSNAGGFAGAIGNFAPAGANNGLAVKVSGTTGLALDVSQGAAVSGVGTSLFAVRGTGNVGIGTNAPNSRLSLSPSTTEAKITLWDGGSTVNHYGFGISNSQMNYHVDAGGASHVFYSGGKNGNGTELMRVVGNGRVGIGTNAPATILDVRTTDGSARITVGTTGATGGGIVFGNASHGIQRGYPTLNSNNNVGFYTTAGNLYLATSGTSTTEFELAAGTVTLGNDLRTQNANNRFRRANTPQVFTDLFDPSSSPLGVHVSNNEAEEGGFWANGNYAAIYSPGDNDLVKFLDEDGFDNAGTVYDGTALRARIDGNGQYFQVSDANAKSNIKPITDGLRKLTSLSGYTYSFNLLPKEVEKGQKPMQAAGVLAQEVERVLPEAVSQENGHYMVNYAALAPLFIQAIKEQQVQIEALKAQNAALQAKAAQADADHADLQTMKAQLARLLGETAPAPAAQARK
ncbi:hypothetical protein GCM10023185_15090 [Hymenobacter saemangeumensis]|uniref:Peptidase S74 domain-containing protein n=1 Tax=Hymenobacter saemangeumensis TaxID=1084522 RepID=A0ABP8I967_9BACT